jgi:hypothetical protein
MLNLFGLFNSQLSVVIALNAVEKSPSAATVSRVEIEKGSEEQNSA